MAELGAPSMRPLENRHDVAPISTDENLRCRLRCRWHIDDRRQTIDPTCPGGSGETPRPRNHFHHHQQPAPRGLRMLLEPLEITTPLGCFDGGVIARPDLSVITALVLPSQVVRCALDMLSERGAQPWIFSGADWLVRDSDGPTSDWRSARWSSDPPLSRISGRPPLMPPKSSVSARISNFSPGANPLAKTGVPSKLVLL
jgi:hypothetical protein